MRSRADTERGALLHHFHVTILGRRGAQSFAKGCTRGNCRMIKTLFDYIERIEVQEVDLIGNFSNFYPVLNL